MKKTKKIAIALSGGIDSLVAASILKKQGADLFGIHFKTGYENRKIDLAKTGERLGIQIITIDLGRAFELHVIDYFIKTYLKGKTPNPCIICNKKIKFDALYKACRDLGADFIATGHYAGIEKDESGHNCLVKARDDTKDQSYFLAMLNQEQLGRTIFPLSDMCKSEVKEFAALNGLIPPEKKESQDICFIKNNSFSEFILLKKAMKPVPGPIVTTDGKNIGTHGGLHKFTIGQRRGLNCPGPAPYYVKRIDIEHNTLVVGFKDELFKTELFLKDIHWTGRPVNCCHEIITKIRYSHKGADSLFVPDISRTNRAKIIFHQGQYAITPGQAAVFYSSNRVLGCGIIQ